jgi:hypothetical protein
MRKIAGNHDQESKAKLNSAALEKGDHGFPDHIWKTLSGKHFS